MNLKKSIEELKNMTDGYTFKDCSMCLKYDENGCKCEYVQAINNVLEELDNLKKDVDMLYKENKRITKLNGKLLMKEE